MVAALLVAACASSARHEVDSASTGPSVPRFAHIVVVVEENHAAREVIGNPHAPYLNSLARSGAVLTQSYGITHPSQPNYVALFSGSTQGLTDNSCPHTYWRGNLATQLRAHGLTFAAYSESLPRAGYRGCSSGAYVRRHAPWTNFPNVAPSLHKPVSAFPSSYAALPRVSFVIPNLVHDMHDGTIGQADRWLQAHMGGYASWARTHNSLLIITWDEDDHTAGNRIPGVIVGAHVRAGRYDQRVDHYTMLRTIEAACRLPAIGRAADRLPITAIWTR